MSDPKSGTAYTCYVCQTRFHDLGQPFPLCPRCGADQREAAEAAPEERRRSRRGSVDEPVPDPAEDEATAPEE